MPDSTPPRPDRPPASERVRSGRRISGILQALAERTEGERISFGDLVDSFSARAYGPLIVLFAAPNILPVALPGISAILGAPLILLTGQLMLGRRHPWLPGFLRRRSLARSSFESLVARIVPRLRQIERWIQPRWLTMTGIVGRRVIGAAGVILATIVFLPIPFGNMLPGIALVLMAVGLAVVSGFIYGIAVAGLTLVRSGLGV